MHEELGSVDEDLVSTVADRAVPPCALRYRKRNKQVDRNREKSETCMLEEQKVTIQYILLHRAWFYWSGLTTTTGRMTIKASPYTNSTYIKENESVQISLLVKYNTSKSRQVYK